MTPASFAAFLDERELHMCGEPVVDAKLVRRKSTFFDSNRKESSLKMGKRRC